MFRNLKTVLCVYVIFFAISFIYAEKGTFISPGHPDIRYTGRIDFADPENPVLFWPGTQVSATFSGTSLKILLDDEKGESFYSVFIDGNEANPVIIDCETGLHIYSICDSLDEGKHQMLLFRRTEASTGPTVFKGMILGDKQTLLPVKDKPYRRIEFYGNSITCGMGNEAPDDGRDNNFAEENNYLAYGAITARKLNAEYRCIAKSGIGILVSWFDLTMPKYYFRLDPDNPESKWDFSSWIPDVVVINLFQNDSWLIEKRLDPVPDREEIIEAYIRFVGNIRAKYPDSRIICTLGSMDATAEGSAWPGYIEEAVRRVKEKTRDGKIATFIFPFKGWGKHPRVRHHQEMADKLAAYIKRTMHW